MKTYRQRLNNIIGQLSACADMIDSDTECQSVLIQLKAAQSATRSLINKYIQDNLETCLNPQNQTEYKKANQLITQIINNN